ncbi:MAG: hypothetical protein P4L46_19540 [Fimbriimonas sp.]|nr:hypothetical protein [Fimbriimonas sp.]
MSFDIRQLHISDNSPEARAVEHVMLAEHVGAEEAILRILRSAQPAATERNFIKEGKGLFNDPADAKILDEAVAIALEERRRPSTQALA